MIIFSNTYLVVYLRELHLSVFSYCKMSFNYSGMSFQIFSISQNNFLISNVCILNAHKLNTLSTICILKCTKNYSKMHASKLRSNAQFKQTLSHSSRFLLFSFLFIFQFQSGLQFHMYSVQMKEKPSEQKTNYIIYIIFKIGEK